MVIIILLFLLLSTTATSHRRILHQPFFPQSSIPPSPPPTQTPPPLPFSTQTNTSTPAPPFFPSYPSPTPPPPSTSTFASFPANISSITLPNYSKPTKPPSRKLIAIAAASVLSALFILSLAIFLHLRTKHSNPNPSLSSKSNRSDTPNPNIPKLNRPSQTSSEFLYLGTLVSSHQPNNINNINVADVIPRKLDSPELRPLPPLSGHQTNYNNNNNRSFVGADVASSKDDDEEFYSPKGSSIGTGTNCSTRQFTYVAVQHERSSSNTTSSSYSSGSGPGSPISLSPGNSVSPVNGMMMMVIPKSPDLIEIQALRPIGFQMPVLESDEVSVSPRSSSSLGKGSRRSSLVSSPRFSTNGETTPVRVESPVIDDKVRFRVESPVIDDKVSFRVESPVIDDKVSFRVESPVIDDKVNFRVESPVIDDKVSFVVPMPPPPPPLPMPQVRRTVSDPPLAPMQPPVLISPVKPITVGNVTEVSSIESSKSLDSGYLKEEEQSEETTPKPKLKPLHWDKVRASSDREMVWDQLKCSSFKLNEEMIETLFVVNAPKPSPKEVPKWQVLPSPGADNGNRVLDPKKAQNISILLRALNVTVEEVCEGLLEGNADTLGTELLESLLKMAPSKEEERKLKDHKDDSPFKLGAAEKFLKAVLDIPNAFKRVEAMLYVSNFDSEVEYLKKSFETLETACEELRASRMFLKLLEAVLKTGNRMNVGTNRGDAHAFKLDTLLKLVDVKAADGKTTLLHFVVQEIIRTEGVRRSSGDQLENPPINDDVKCRKLGLQVVSTLSSSLSNVKKAAAMDAEVLSSDVSKLSKGIMNIGEVARLNESKSLLESGSGNFSESMKCFMKKAEEEIIRIQAQESVALSLVKEITEYFHGNSAKEEAHPFRIFLVVRDFLTVLDRVCKEVGMINERTIVSSAHKFPVPINPMLQSGMGGFPNQRLRSSSDEESSSP